MGQIVTCCCVVVMEERRSFLVVSDEVRLEVEGPVGDTVVVPLGRTGLIIRSRTMH